MAVEAQTRIPAASSSDLSGLNENETVLSGYRV